MLSKDTEENVKERMKSGNDKFSKILFFIVLAYIGFVLVSIFL
jgi:hypothetical protein